MATATSLRGRGVINAYDAIAASATDSVLITGVANKRIRVLGVIINQGDTTPSTVTLNTKPAGAGTAISPPLKAAANGGFVIPYSEVGYFATNTGEGLTVTTGAGSTTSVVVLYDLVA
jgi:hypothetical protein